MEATMKNVGVIPNLDKDPELIFTKEVIGFLVEKCCNVFTSRKVVNKIHCPQTFTDMHEIYTRSDFLIVMGGDGTILRVARNAALQSTPILGINIGTLGYLADVEKGNAFKAIEQALAGNYKLEKRIMLEASILTEKTNNENYLALNEVSIGKGVFTTIMELELRINDEFIENFWCDGILVCTPTGSTGYNLSAGGPILKPDLNVITVTPVCAHMMFNRSFVVSDSDRVHIKIIGGGHHSDGVLSMDSHNRVQLKEGDEISVFRSPYHTTLMKTESLGFYEILRNKMRR